MLNMKMNKDSGRGFGIRDEKLWILCDLNTSGLQENWVGFDLKLEGQRKGKSVQKEIHDIDRAIMEWDNILPQWSSSVFSQSEHG